MGMQRLTLCSPATLWSIYCIFTRQRLFPSPSQLFHHRWLGPRSQELMSDPRRLLIRWRQLPSSEVLVGQGLCSGNSPDKPEGLPPLTNLLLVYLPSWPWLCLDGDVCFNESGLGIQESPEWGAAGALCQLDSKQTREA